MSKNHKIVIGVLVALLLVGAVATYLIIRSEKKEVLDETVALFSNEFGTLPYTDLNGNEVFLDQYLGKILVVATWASWSPFSQADLQTLSELSSEYSSEEVIFLAINRKETVEQAARYMNSIPKVDGVVLVLDPTDRYYGAVGGYAMPEAVIYNQRGEIVNHLRGMAAKADIKATIDTILSVGE